MSLLARNRSLVEPSSPVTSPATFQASSPRQITPPSTKKLSIVKLPSLKPLSSARTPSPPTVKIAAATPSSHSDLNCPAREDSIRLPRCTSLSILTLHTLAQDVKSVQSSVKRLVLPIEGGLARDAVGEALKELAGSVASTDKVDECAAIVGKAVSKNKRMASLCWMKEWLWRGA